MPSCASGEMAITEQNPGQANRRRRKLPTDQRIRPAMRLTDPPTIATPNTYDRRA
jgi:hypothetical protein